MRKLFKSIQIIENIYESDILKHPNWKPLPYLPTCAWLVIILLDPFTLFLPLK